MEQPGRKGQTERGNSKPDSEIRKRRKGGELRAVKKKERETGHPN